MSRFCIYVLVVGGAAALAAVVRSLRRGRADPFADPGRALAREGNMPNVKSSWKYERFGETIRYLTVEELQRLFGSVDNYL